MTSASVTFGDGVGEEPGDPFDDLVEHGIGDVEHGVLQRGDDVAGCRDADRPDADVGEHSHGIRSLSSNPARVSSNRVAVDAMIGREVNRGDRVRAVDHRRVSEPPLVVLPDEFDLRGGVVVERSFRGEGPQAKEEHIDGRGLGRCGCGRVC